ncbi:MAG: HEAT repeat domain-containing protein [Candidatus Krumholzibacteriia bacterium]
MTRRRHTTAALLGAGLLALGAAACGPGTAERDAHLAAVARWQDARLAPLDSMTTLLAGPDAHVRLAAVRAAGLIGRDDVLPRLLERLADRSPTVRQEACFALGVLGDTLAVPALEEAATDRRTALRLAALRGLAQVPNRGGALLAVVAAGEPAEQAAAWDALRNQAERVPRAGLLGALQAGLTTAEPDVLWRVLRCAEVVPDSTLVPLVVPHAGSGEPQVRVHAYRALARLGGPVARAAVLATCDDGRFAGRDRVRVAVAACRALGALAAAAADQDLHPVAVHLVEQAGAPHPHVAQVALEAMAASSSGLRSPRTGTAAPGSSR